MINNPAGIENGGEVDSDPILERRRKLGRLATQAKRIGYSLFTISVVLFVVGFFTSFTALIVTAVVLALSIGSIVLAPALVMSYGVGAANRADRQSATDT